MNIFCEAFVGAGDPAQVYHSLSSPIIGRQVECVSLRISGQPWNLEGGLIWTRKNGPGNKWNTHRIKDEHYPSIETLLAHLRTLVPTIRSSFENGVVTLNSRLDFELNGPTSSLLGISTGLKAANVPVSGRPDLSTAFNPAFFNTNWPVNIYAAQPSGTLAHVYFDQDSDFNTDGALNGRVKMTGATSSPPIAPHSMQYVLLSIVNSQGNPLRFSGPARLAVHLRIK